MKGRWSRLWLIAIGLIVGLVLCEIGVWTYGEWIVWLPYRNPPAYEDDPRGIRLAVIGGSTSKGSPYHGILQQIDFEPEFNLLTMVKLFLERDARYAPVTVDRYANGGWPTAEAVKFYWKTARYKPDIMVLYAGHNEKRSYYSPNMRPPPRFLAPLSALGTGNLLLRRFFLRQADPEDREYSGEFLGLRFVPAYESTVNRDRFRDYVDLLIRHCENEGIFLIIVIPESNHLYPPLRSVYDGPEERRLEALQKFKLAYYHKYQENDLERARAVLEDLDGFCGFADLYYELGELYYEEGDAIRAETYLERANDADPLGFASSAYKEILRTLASDHAVPTIDMHRVITERLGASIPDYSVFVDACHFRPHTYQALAQEILQVLRERNPGALKIQDEEYTLSEDEWVRGLGLSHEVVALGWVSASKWSVDEAGETFLRLRRMVKSLDVFRTLQSAGLLSEILEHEIPPLETKIEVEKARELAWLQEPLAAE